MIRRRMLASTVIFAAGVLVGALAVGPLHAQSGGIKRAMLLRADLSGVPGRETLMGTAEVAPGAAAGPHAHPGPEIGYVLEGTARLEVEGQRARTLKAGDVYHVEAGRVHDAKNTGATPAKVLAVWIVEKGKPFALTAPPPPARDR